VLQRLNRIIPGFQEHIVHCQSASAHTSHRFTLNYHGAMLGWEMSPDQLGESRPAVTSPVAGLYFVGHWTRPGGGITPVIISAMNVAARVTGSHAGRTFRKREMNPLVGESMEAGNYSARKTHEAGPIEAVV
jgi:phytoene dehydrogenase-like protein